MDPLPQSRVRRWAVPREQPPRIDRSADKAMTVFMVSAQGRRRGWGGEQRREILMAVLVAGAEFAGVAASRQGHTQGEAGLGAPGER